MIVYPRILPKDLYKTYLARKVIREFLRNVSDLDVDIESPAPPPNDPDPKLVEARRKLDLFVRQIEDETLYFFSDTVSSTVDSTRFTEIDGLLQNQQTVALAGYVEVTQEAIDAQLLEDSMNPMNPEEIVPRYPDGELYNVGDPNIVQMDGALLLALRSTVASVARHEVEQPSMHLLLKRAEDGSREEYAMRSRPKELYTQINRFDVSTPWF